MRGNSCKSIIPSFKKASKKFKVKNFSKKKGLFHFNCLAQNIDTKNNKNFYNSLKKYSLKVKPYTHFTGKHLNKYFSAASKNYKKGKCKKVFLALKKASLKSKKGKVTRKNLLKFYNSAEELYR